MIKSTRVIDAMMGVTSRLWAGTVFLLLLCGNAQAVLVYQAQVRSMNLTAPGVNGPLVFHLDAAQVSTGMVSVAPEGTAGDINPGDGKATVVGSFFDIFAELEPMNCFPNCPDKTPVEEHIKTSGSCVSLANFFDVFPPDCPFEGDQTFTIEDVIAVVTEFLFNLSLPTVVPFAPGWDFALLMATTLDIQTNPARGYQFVGETVIDFRQVPEPATVLLVLLALGATTVAWRRRHAGARPQA